MPKTKMPQGVHRALEDLSAARRALTRARRKLARLSRPGGPSDLVSNEWQWARDLLEARREKLQTIPGVVGIGLGIRRRGDIPTGEACITVYVRRKLPLAELAAEGQPRLPKIALPKAIGLRAAAAMEAAARRTGKEPLVTYKEAVFTSSSPHFSNEKAKRELGFTVRPLDETLTRAITYFKENGIA